MSLPDPFVDDPQNQRNFDALNKETNSLQTQLNALSIEAGYVNGTAVAAVTTVQDVPSATVTLTPLVASKLVVTGIFAYSIIGAAAAVDARGVGYLNVDGTDQTRIAILSVEDSDSASHRFLATVSQVWVVSLVAGAHTIKLRCERAAGTTALALGGETGFSYLLFKD